jgi:hypothetical protein
MASHLDHTRLPGYDPGNRWHDGCPECEKRAADPVFGMTTLDPHRFRAAWTDMVKVNYLDQPLGRELSRCDERLLGTLYVFSVVLHRATSIHPADLMDGG